MNCCFDNKIKNFVELKLKYDGYNELKKLSMDRYISTYFKEIIDRKYINYYDDENVKKIHNMILKLDSLTSLVDFDAIFFDMYYEYGNKKIIEEEVNNVLKLAYKKLEPFIFYGFSNQLQVKRYCDVNPFKFNNLVLDVIGREFVLDNGYFSDDCRTSF